jgi:hypothetical protein
MLEKWLKMDSVLSRDVRLTIMRGLGALHLHCANWHLERVWYRKACQSVASAVKYKITLGTTVKFILTWLAPALGRK